MIIATRQINICYSGVNVSFHCRCLFVVTSDSEKELWRQSRMQFQSGAESNIHKLVSREWEKHLFSLNYDLISVTMTKYTMFEIIMKKKKDIYILGSLSL